MIIKFFIRKIYCILSRNVLTITNLQNPKWLHVHFKKILSPHIMCVGGGGGGRGAWCVKENHYCTNLIYHCIKQVIKMIPYKLYLCSNMVFVVRGFAIMHSR